MDGCDQGFWSAVDVLYYLISYDPLGSQSYRRCRTVSLRTLFAVLFVVLCIFHHVDDVVWNVALGGCRTIRAPLSPKVTICLKILLFLLIVLRFGIKQIPIALFHRSSLARFSLITYSYGACRRGDTIIILAVLVCRNLLLFEREWPLVVY